MTDFQDKELAKSHRQNQLQLLQGEDSDQVVQQADKEQFYPSQLAQSVYHPMLASAQSLTLEQMSQRLKRYEIQFQKTSFCNSFQKHCIRTDWESTDYEIKYGSFKSNLKIIVMKMEPRILCNKFLSKGNFGEIINFEFQKNKSLALKNIKFQPEVVESLDLALRQVFMAKLFSALQFGPKFSKIFAYDAIIYEGSVQFAMEMCEKDYTKDKIEHQITNKTLFTCLKSIHKLKICHLDIKYENIGWSPTFEKFIFLDFSFTSNIKEPIGYKTMTKYMGTFNYCSPQMRKLFFLKQSSYIDLYYNDLFGLEEVWKDFALNRIRKSQQCALPSQAKQSRPNKNTIEDNMTIVRYFKVKFSIFEQYFDDLRQIIQREKVLVNTFRKITQVSQSQTVDSFQFKLLHDIACNNPQQEASENKIDQILYSYEMEKETKQSATSFFETMLKICDSDPLFLKLWQQELWRQRIFFFFDVYSHPEKEQPRKKLIQKVHSQIERDQNKIQPISLTMKFRAILLFYSHFFYGKKNIIILERIMTYFSLFKDYTNFQMLESFILQLWQNEEKYDEFLRENLKYFIGKIVVNPKQWAFQLNLNISKMIELSKKISLHPEKYSRDLLGKIRKIIDLMLLIQNLQKKIYSQCWKLQAKLQIKQIVAFFNFGTEIIQFMEEFLFQAPIQPHEKKKKTYKNIYLQKCAFQTELQQLLKQSKILTYRQMVQNDDLFKQFSLFYKTSYLTSVQKQAQKQEKSQILNDYLFMNRNKGLIIDPQYFYALSFSKSFDEAFKEAVLFLESFEIEKLANLQKIFHLKFSLPLFLTANAGFKKFSKFNVQRQTINKLNGLCSTILQFTSNIDDFRGKCQSELVLLQTLNQEVSKDLFKLNHLFLTVSLLLSKGSEQEALDFIFQQNQRFLTQVFEKNLLIFVSDKILSKKISEMQEKILKVGLQKSLAEYYIQQPKFVIHILEIYRKRSQFSQIIIWMSKLCQIVHVKAFPFFKVKLTDVISKIIKTYQPLELQKLIKQGACLELKAYSNFPVLIYFLALAWFKLESQKIAFPQKNRLIIICAAFMDNLKQGYFRRLKEYITHQVEGLQPNKIKRTKKLVMPHNINYFLNNIKHKNISKLAVESVRESLRCRLKQLLKNRTDAHEIPYTEIFEPPNKLESIWNFNHA